MVIDGFGKPDLQFAVLNWQFAIVPTPHHAAVADPPRASGTFISLCFWLSLFFSGALFAAATLSGKILDTERRASELATETATVEQLALEVHRLGLKARALEADPDYIAAVARRKLAGEPVTDATPRSQPTPLAVTPPTPLDPRLETLRPWMHRIASDSLLRARLLTIAAALVLFAFTFLQERSPRETTSLE